MTKNQTIDIETTSKKAFQKLALNFGVLTGLFSILLSVIVYVMGVYLEKPWWSTVLITLVGFGITYYAFIHYRRQLGVYLTFGKAQTVGVDIVVVGGVSAIVYY